MSLRIEHISKIFSLPSGATLTVLNDISFIAEDGDFVVVVGESGCGKSTLLNLIAGLLPLTSGAILADNQKITGTHPSRSILFQQPSLLPWLNTMENIVFGCKLRGELNNLEERSEQLIEIMGLSGFENHYPHELSVGMAQRACLARALMGHPKILLLDEPFGALDSMNRTRLQEELIEFWAVENFTVIFVTHDIDEAIVLGNKIVVLGDRPAHIIEIFENKMNYPRDIFLPEFFDLREEILHRLRQASDH